MDRPEIDWPASSTIGDFLHREGLAKPRSREPARKPPEIEPTAANESGSADFKGWFRSAFRWRPSRFVGMRQAHRNAGQPRLTETLGRTGDGVRCDPLTVTDNDSRYLLACAAVPQRLRCELCQRLCYPMRNPRRRRE